MELACDEDNVDQSILWIGIKPEENAGHFAVHEAGREVSQHGDRSSLPGPHHNDEKQKKQDF